MKGKKKSEPVANYEGDRNWNSLKLSRLLDVERSWWGWEAITVDPSNVDLTEKAN